MAYIGNEPADRFTSIPTVQQFNGDASTTAFTLNRAVGSDQDLLVSVDGVIQDTAAYAVSNGTTLTFSAAPSQGTANIFVNHLGLTIGSVVHPASSALAATTGAFSGKITADAGIDIDNFNIDGTTIALSSGDMTLDSAADIILDAAGSDILLKKGGTTFGSFKENSSNFRIKSEVSDKDMLFMGNDGGSEITALTLDMSEAGQAAFNKGATFGGIVTVAPSSVTTGLRLQGRSSDNNFFVQWNSNDGGTNYGSIGSVSASTALQYSSDGHTFTNQATNSEFLSLTSSGAIFNEGSADRDFRIESNANTHAFHINANDENIGFGNQIDITANGMYMHVDANNAHMVIANLDDDDDVPLLKLNRQSADGRLIYFLQANSLEGSVSVSGSTVSYNGFAGRHESSGIPTNTAVGTVLSTIDELDTYPATTKNEALEAMTHPKAGEPRADHAKVKVSDSVGDKRVYGVVNEFDSDGKVYVTSVGISAVKVTGACAGGDLIESNGDGTAKVQSDDIVRSKTIGKVTIGNSSTDVKLVSCVLYCG